MIDPTTMTYAEYQVIAQEFRDLLIAEAAKPREEQQWPDPWLGVAATATCRNAGSPAGGVARCPVEGVSYQIQIMESANGLYQAGCGRCGRGTEIVAEFSDGPQVLLEAPEPTPVPDPGAGEGDGSESEGEVIAP